MSNKIPLISIVLPVYNGEEFLSQAIQSCLDQTHINFELIIVNDASTDTSLEIAEGFSKIDKRVTIVSNQQNQQLPASLNIGHKLARGDFFTWISDDNFFEPEALEKMLTEIKKWNVGLVYSRFRIIDIHNKECGMFNGNPGGSILLDNLVGASFLHTRAVFERNGGYDEALFQVEDYAFWLKASRNSRFHFLPEVLYNYRRHENSLTAKKTIKHLSYKNDYCVKVALMYTRFFQGFDVKNEVHYGNLFGKIHLHQEVDVYDYLRKKRQFNKDLKRVWAYYDKEEISRGIDLKLRYNILNFPSNQNYRTLLMIIAKRHRILTSYINRKSFKIIYNSLFRRLTHKGKIEHFKEKIS